MKKSSDTRGVAKAMRARHDAPVKLEEVARAAGVSPSTVSRILNGTATVSEDKKKAVDDAIAKLGFVPNPIARGLAGGRTLSVGVITQAIDSPFYGVALRGIEDELDPAGYCPLFVSGHWDPKTEARCIDVLRSRRVDGIIVLTGRLADQALKVCAKRTPVVVTGRSLRVPEDVSIVGFDDLPTSLYAIPPLSTVHQPAYEMGRLAAAAMLELLSGTAPTVGPPLPRLVVRESVRRLNS